MEVCCSRNQLTMSYALRQRVLDAVRALVKVAYDAAHSGECGRDPRVLRVLVDRELECVVHAEAASESLPALRHVGRVVGDLPVHARVHRILSGPRRHVELQRIDCNLINGVPCVTRRPKWRRSEQPLSHRPRAIDTVAQHAHQRAATIRPDVARDAGLDAVQQQITHELFDTQLALRAHRQDMQMDVAIV
eukprot:1089458-Prymnesium_polylepis.1